MHSASWVAGPLGGPGGAVGPQLRRGRTDEAAGLQVHPVLVVCRGCPSSTTSTVADVGPALLDAGQVGLSAAGDQGERLAGGGADDGGVARVPEVGVGVHIDQSDAGRRGPRRGGAWPAPSRARPSSRRPARPGTRRPRRCAPIRSASRGRVRGDVRGLAHPVAGPPVARVEPGRGAGSRRRGPEPRHQAVVAQRAGRLRAARHRGRGRRTQPEVGRRVEDGDAAHRLRLRTARWRAPGGRRRRPGRPGRRR